MTADLEYELATERQLPRSERVLIGSQCASYEIVEHVMVLSDAVPADVCDQLVAVAETVGKWSGSTQVDTNNNTLYHDKRRTSSSQTITEEVFGAELRARLIVALYEAARFYACWNKNVNWRRDSGWELVRYEPGQLFQEHCDVVMGTRTTNRALSLLAYLNDVEEGGETVFTTPGPELVITPAKGKLAIFPPFWTHPHSGEPPVSGNKYVALGWLTA